MNIVTINNETFLDSRQVARMIGKRHDNLIRDIDKYITVLANSKMRALTIYQNSKMRTDKFFIQSSYKAGTGKRYPRYLISKMGCDFLANKLRGDKGIKFTFAYVQAFNTMKAVQIQKQGESWQQIRRQSKEEQKRLGDVIKIFVAYAKEQGSRHADNYYTLFGKLTNKFSDVMDRENADIIRLYNVISAIKAITTAIISGMARKEPYKQIYQSCKQRLELLQVWGVLQIAG